MATVAHTVGSGTAPDGSTYSYGYDYDDQTLVVVLFWSVNNTGAKLQFSARRTADGRIYATIFPPLAGQRTFIPVANNATDKLQLAQVGTHLDGVEISVQIT